MASRTVIVLGALVAFGMVLAVAALALIGGQELRARKGQSQWPFATVHIDSFAPAFSEEAMPPAASDKHEKICRNTPGPVCNVQKYNREVLYGLIATGGTGALLAVVAGAFLGKRLALERRVRADLNTQTAVQHQAQL